MASFTQKQTPTFTDYVAQKPVDAMVKVGMYKQQKYEEGYEKIQDSIDRVAGMEVARPQDKEYLQAKLNELGNNLNFVAAGDFSNFQLTNSVAGYADKIVNDERMQSAVSSTQYYKRGLSDMRAANKGGKGSPSNTYNFNRKAQAWFNGEDDATFNSDYMPYVDYKKNTLEIIKQLTGNETITDDAFHYEGNRLVIHDAIVREEMSGVTPEQIQQALMSGLSPADWQQISMDGEYTYSNVDGKTFGNRIQTQYDTQISDLRKQRLDLQNELSGMTNLQKKNAANHEIKLLTNKIEQTKRRYDGIISSVNNGQYDSAKASLFTSDYIHGISQAFSNTKRSRTIRNNPYADMAFKRNKLRNEYSRWATTHNLNVERFEEVKKQNTESNKLKREANALKRQELTGFAGAGSGLPSSIPTEELPPRTLGTMMNKIDARDKRIATKDAEISANQKPGWLKARIEQFEDTGTSGDPITDEWLTERRDLQIANDIDQIAITETKDLADEVLGVIEDKISDEDNSLGFILDDQVYTVKDIVQFNSIRDKYVVDQGVDVDMGQSFSKGVKWDHEKARQEMSDKEYSLWKVFANYHANTDMLGIHTKKSDPENPGVGVSPEEMTMMDNIKEYQKKYNKPYEKVLKQKNEFINEQVGSRVSISQGVEYGFEMKGADLRARIAPKFAQIANVMEETGEGWPNTDVSVANVRAIAADLEHATMKVIEGNDYQEAQYILSGMDSAGGVVRLPLTRNQKVSMFGNQVFEQTPAGNAVQVYDNVIRKLTAKEYGSTSIDKQPTNRANSYLHGKRSFPNVSVYGISGNVEKTESGQYSVYINIFDPVTNKTFAEGIPFPSTALMPRDKVPVALQSLTDERIFEMIYGAIPATEIKTRQDLLNLFKDE